MDGPPSSILACCSLQWTVPTPPPGRRSSPRSTASCIASPRARSGRQGWGVSLGATSLLHEAYLDLSKRDPSAFPDRNRFMGYAARVMRGLIIDYARNRQAVKRGGHFELTALSTDALNVAAAVETDELVRISQALDDLSSVEPVLADVVDLKFFCGFSFEEIAAMKGVSDRTVRRYWVKARAYLHVSLRDMLAG